MFGMAIGTAAICNQVHALLGVAVLVAAYGRKIRLEDAALQSAFGAEDGAYRRRTWALVPGIF